MSTFAGHHWSLRYSPILSCKSLPLPTGEMSIEHNPVASGRCQNIGLLIEWRNTDFSNLFSARAANESVHSINIGMKWSTASIHFSLDTSTPAWPSKILSISCNIPLCILSLLGLVSVPPGFPIDHPVYGHKPPPPLVIHLVGLVLIRMGAAEVQYPNPADPFRRQHISRFRLLDFQRSQQSARYPAFHHHSLYPEPCRHLLHRQVLVVEPQLRPFDVRLDA